MMLTFFHFNKRAISVWCYILITLTAYMGIKLYYLAHISKNLTKNPNEEYIRNNTSQYMVKSSYKYILIRPNATKFKLLEKGDESFVKNNCEYKNCFATDDVQVLSSVKEFDAVIFNGVDMTTLSKREITGERSPKQKYIFSAFESAVYVPMCFEYFDGFFNWTWTYKLDSDIVTANIKIYDLEGSFVGPKVNMKWVKTMLPIDEALKSKLSKKHKAAAWVVSQCITLSEREHLVKSLRVQLVRFGLAIDIYGKCGARECPTTMQCRSFLVALIIAGAYLDARELSDVELAYEIDEIINNRTLYYDFFRWRNHYKYTSAENMVKDNVVKNNIEKKDVCKLCDMLNNKHQMSKVTVWEKFREWWNEGNFDCSYY